MNNSINNSTIKLMALVPLSVALALSAIGCKQKIQAEIAQTPKVKAVPASVREQPDETSGFGSLSFLAKIDITSTQDGVIKKLHFREGDKARQGEEVLLLENPQINLAVERAEINYSQALASLDLSKSRLQEGEFQAEAQLLSIEKAEAELERAKINWEEEKRKHQNQEILFNAGGLHEEAIRASRFALQAGWDQIQILEKELAIRRIGCRDRDLLSAGFEIPDDGEERQKLLIFHMTTGLRTELGAAQSHVEATSKELVSIQMARNELSIQSPVPGVIGARYFEEGERVKSGDKIYTLMDTSSLYAMFPVREKDALRLENGMEAMVLVDGTGETRKGRVDLVYPQADSQSLSFLVRVLLDKGNSGLKPGMFARVFITLGPPKQLVTIPESAIINKKGSEGTVFILNGSVAAERRVVMGTVSGDEREISAGISHGELVVLQPGSAVREGVYVSLAE